MGEPMPLTSFHPLTKRLRRPAIFIIAGALILSLLRGDKMTDLHFPVESDDFRALRIVADTEMSRRNPGWLCCMFHYGRYIPSSGRGRWLMVYSIQLTRDSIPKMFTMVMGHVQMADGSTVWAWVQA
jgi:hypothetical protein